MKLLDSAAFLGLELLIVAVSSWQMRLNMRQLGTGRSMIVLSRLISIAMLGLVLLQFWFLTRFFSVGLLLIMSAALIIQWVIIEILGAIFGTAIPERRTKIQVLTLIWGMQRWAAGCFFLSSSLIAITVSMFGSLWVFWGNDVGSDDAKVGIALFMFVIPALIMLPAVLLVLWPITTSPYLDDDVRNYHLLSTLSSVVPNAVYWLFPVWIFHDSFNHKFPDLPPFWVLLSVPLLVFLFIGLLPFFVGAYLFRAQSREILDWRKQWITSLLHILQLPPGDHRTEDIHLKRSELENELERRFSENEVIALYRQIVSTDEEQAVGPVLEVSGVLRPVESSSVPSLAFTTSTMRNEDTLAQGVELLRDFQTGQVNIGNPYFRANQQLCEMMQVMLNHANRLVDWDVRFAHISELFHLRRVMDTIEPKGDRVFLETSLKQIEDRLATLEPKRSFMLGGSLTLFSSASMWVFKNYDAEIVSALEEVVRTNLG